MRCVCRMLPSLYAGPACILAEEVGRCWTGCDEDDKARAVGINARKSNLAGPASKSGGSLLLDRGELRSGRKVAAARPLQQSVRSPIDWR
jgi:hypothetical protein